MNRSMVFSTPSATHNVLDLRGFVTALFAPMMIAAAAYDVQHLHTEKAAVFHTQAYLSDCANRDVFGSSNNLIRSTRRKSKIHHLLRLGLL